MKRLSVPVLLVAVVAAVPLALSGGATATPGEVSAKRAEARRVLNEVHNLDVQMEKAVEQYNFATIQLRKIDTDLRQTKYQLGIARSSLRASKLALARRVVGMYTSNDDTSALAVLFGASSVQEAFDRMEQNDRISSQDTRVIAQVTSMRDAVSARKKRLAKAREAQRQIVSQRASQQAQIRSQLAERKAKLSTIRDEVARLKREEVRRQRALAAQAQTRLQKYESSPPPSIGPVPSSTVGGQAVNVAMQYLGVPYVWGGASPSGFDCSGFTMYVYSQVGISLPHYTVSQFAMGTPVDRSALEPGDLVFFDGLGHVGMYIGGGQFIHAPHTGDVVKISSLSEDWYASTYVGARRYGV